MAENDHHQTAASLIPLRLPVSDDRTYKVHVLAKQEQILSIASGRYCVYFYIKFTETRLVNWSYLPLIDQTIRVVSPEHVMINLPLLAIPICIISILCF